MKKLILRLKQGDTQALEEIISLYNNYVAKIVYSMLATYFTEIDIQAVINQVFFQLWKNSDQINLEQVAYFDTYIAKIARNVALNEKRKLKEHLPLEENIIGESEHEFLRLELKEVMYKALEKLKPSYKKILIKYYYEEKYIREIADEEGVTENSIKSSLKRAREQLKIILIKEGIVNETPNK